MPQQTSADRICATVEWWMGYFNFSINYYDPLIPIDINILHALINTKWSVCLLI